MNDTAIDLEALRRLLNVVGGDPEDLQELLDDFVESAPETVGEIREASEAGDLNALRVASHSLKANARDFGANRLASLCENLEHACRSGSVDDPLKFAQEIEAEETVVRAALSALHAEDV